MKLIIIFGPQACGKMTVGKHLSKLTGYKMLHNHISIEVALQYFNWGTEEFGELDSTIRYKIFELLKRSGQEAMIFTFTWGLNLDSDWTYIKKLINDYSEETYFIELTASLETRLERNEMPDRLNVKPSKKDIELSRKLIIGYDKTHKFNTKNDFPFDNHLIINTEVYTAEQSAKQIIKYFDFNETLSD